MHCLAYFVLVSCRTSCIAHQNRFSISLTSLTCPPRRKAGLQFGTRVTAQQLTSAKPPFTPFDSRCVFNPALKLGCLFSTSRNHSLGSCNRLPKLAGAIIFANLTNPSHNGGFVQTSFLTSFGKIELAINGMRDLYVDTAWMVVRRNTTGSVGRSVIREREVERTSERKTVVIEKQMPIASSQ